MMGFDKTSSFLNTHAIIIMQERNDFWKKKPKPLDQNE
jgi:hypothetical protein